MTRALQADAVQLRERFTAFALRTDLLEDMARMAGIEEVREVAASMKAARFGSSIEVEKQEEDLPPAALAAVRRAMSRAERLWDEFELQIRAGILSGSIASFEAGAQGPMRQMGFRGSFELRNPRVLDYLSTRANMLAGGVSDSSFDAIVETITRGFYVDGKNPIEVARDLRGEFNNLSGPRSRTIARTESLIASEQGLYEQHYSIGAEANQWFCISGPTSREWHIEVNREIVPIFEPFRVRNSEGGVDEMLHAGDPTAHVSNLANCTCATGAIIETSDAQEPWLGD